MTNHMREVIQHFRRAVLLRDGAGMTDGQLLDRFIERQDQDAFEALMRLHGPMVFGVCRRLLKNHQDAEDAFQATFLVLARKAGGIARRELFANWLYGVARRTALKAKAAALRRGAQEKQVTEMPEPETTRNEVWADLEPVLDQELGSLPEKYRSAIVLCDLEGKTEKEGARQLGLPQGTLSARLVRGRAMLTRRLARHGFALSAGTLVMLISQNSASANVPSTLMVSTVKAASSLAASQAVPAGLVSVHVAALTRGVLKSMFLTQLKTVLVALTLIVGASLGVGGLVAQIPAGAELPREPERTLAQDTAVAKSTTQTPSGGRSKDVNKGGAAVDATILPLAERKILSTLDMNTSVELVDTPIREAISILKDYHNFEHIFIDNAAFAEDGISDDTPITLNVADLSLKSVLELMLSPLQLDYLIKNEVMMITTLTRANQTFETRIYDLKNLGPVFSAKEIGRTIIETIAPDSWSRRNFANRVGSEEVELKVEKTEGENGSEQPAGALPAASRKVAEDGKAMVSVLEGTLIIRQTQRNHREITQFLKELGTVASQRASH